MYLDESSTLNCLLHPAIKEESKFRYPRAKKAIFSWRNNTTKSNFQVSTESLKKLTMEEQKIKGEKGWEQVFNFLA